MRKLLTLTALLLIVSAGQAAARNDWTTNIKPKPLPCSTGSVAQKSTCMIWRTFARGFRNAAIRVAQCETVNFTDFYNESSGATDLFQELPGNNGRVFHLNGRHIHLNYDKLSHKGPTWHMVFVAYFQSKGGTDWGEWVCKP